METPKYDLTLDENGFSFRFVDEFSTGVEGLTIEISDFVFSEHVSMLVEVSDLLKNDVNRSIVNLLMIKVNAGNLFKMDGKWICTMFRIKHHQDAEALIAMATRRGEDNDDSSRGNIKRIPQLITIKVEE